MLQLFKHVPWAKAKSPIVFTDLGRVKLFSELQPWNANCRMWFRESGSIKLSKDWQS